MSFTNPSHVSATTGSEKSPEYPSPLNFLLPHSITASRTTPTLCVFVIITGEPSPPDSSTQVVPVISPLPFSVCHAAKTRPLKSLPCGKIAVTPVRMAVLPSPEISVVYPTSTPFTSVIAFSRPGVPSKGTPRSRARGLVWEKITTLSDAMATTIAVSLINIFISNSLSLHRDRRVFKPHPLPKLLASSPGTNYPGDIRIVAHQLSNHLSADSSSAPVLCDRDSSDITVRHHRTMLLRNRRSDRRQQPPRSGWRFRSFSENAPNPQRAFPNHFLPGMPEPLRGRRSPGFEIRSFQLSVISYSEIICVLR